MSEQSVIEKTPHPITKNDLVNALKNAGLGCKDHVLLHTSLSKIGWVVGREMTVVDAFLATLHQGTLVMPAHTGDNSDPATWMHPPVPESWIEVIRTHTPSFNKHTFTSRGIGRVSECFRHYPNVKRSNHPLDSFIAKGKYARKITKKHVLTPAFGMDTPLGRLYQLNGKVCLIGVSYDRATILHLAEALSEALPLESNGVKFKDTWITFKDFDYDNEPFLALGEALEKKQLAKSHQVGHTDMIVFDIKPAVDFAVSWLKSYYQKKR
ncbi:MAG: aminoglycoside N(3)-acetyltransferase [Acholeplasmataceae bacterium]